jgi:hypothetical protein
MLPIMAGKNSLASFQRNTGFLRSVLFIFCAATGSLEHTQHTQRVKRVRRFTRAVHRFAIA